MEWSVYFYEFFFYQYTFMSYVVYYREEKQNKNTICYIVWFNLCYNVYWTMSMFPHTQGKTYCRPTFFFWTPPKDSLILRFTYLSTLSYLICTPDPVNCRGSLPGATTARNRLSGLFFFSRVRLTLSPFLPIMPLLISGISLWFTWPPLQASNPATPARPTTEQEQHVFWFGFGACWLCNCFHIVCSCINTAGSSYCCVVFQLIMETESVFVLVWVGGGWFALLTKNVLPVIAIRVSKNCDSGLYQNN